MDCRTAKFDVNSYAVFLLKHRQINSQTDKKYKWQNPEPSNLTFCMCTHFRLGLGQNAVGATPPPILVCGVDASFKHYTPIYGSN